MKTLISWTKRLLASGARVAAVLGVLAFASSAFGNYVKEWNTDTTEGASGDWADSSSWIYYDTANSWATVDADDVDSTVTIDDYRIGNGASTKTVSFSSLVTGDSCPLYLYNYTTTFSASADAYGLAWSGSLVIAPSWGGNAYLTITAGAYSFSSVSIQPSTLTGSLTLSGGTLSTSAVTGSGTLAFNGGTLTATADGTLIGSGLTVTVDETNGGTIDTAGYAVTVASAISGGTLTLTGGGIVTFTTAPTCAIEVEDGVVVLDPGVAPSSITIDEHGALGFDLTDETITTGTAITLATTTLTIPSGEDYADSIFTIGPDFTGTLAYSSSVLTITPTAAATGKTRRVTVPKNGNDAWMDNGDYWLGGFGPNCEVGSGGNNAYVSTYSDVVVYPSSAKLYVWGSNHLCYYHLLLRGATMTIHNGDTSNAAPLVFEEINGAGSLVLSDNQGYDTGTSAVNLTVNSSVSGNSSIITYGDSTLTALWSSSVACGANTAIASADSSAGTITLGYVENVPDAQLVASSIVTDEDSLADAVTAALAADSYNFVAVYSSDSLELTAETKVKLMTSSATVTTSLASSWKNSVEYAVSSSTTDGITTYTCANQACTYTWNGSASTSWANTGNWTCSNGTATRVLDSNDTANIPSNSSITLGAVAYAASIVADSTVMISTPIFSYPSGLKTALQNSNWNGDLKFNSVYNTGESFVPSEYGNSASTITLYNCTFYRFSDSAATMTLILEGSVVATGTYTTSDDRYRRNYSLALNILKGTGSFNVAGNSSGYYHNMFVADGSNFTGSLTVNGNYFAFIDPPTWTARGNQYGTGKIYVDSAKTVGIGYDTTWTAESTIDIAGILKLMSVDDASTTTATLKAPTVTFEDGATISYAKLGNIAIVDANDDAAVPTLSGTVTINIPSGVTPSDVDTTLMTWATEETQTITADNFTLSGSLSSDDYELEVVDNSTLVLHNKNAAYSVYVSDAAAYEYITLQEAVAKAVELGYDNYDYIYVTANGSAMVTQANASALKIKTDDGITATITLSDTTEYSIEAGEADENGVVEYSTAPAATTYTWAGTASGNWSTTSDWTYGDDATATRTPTSGDTVVIPATEYTLTYDGTAAITLAALTVGEGSTLEIGDYAIWTAENALTVSGAGWVKLDTSSIYSSATLSVSSGTLEFTAGATFVDIAAATVYVSGTVTGTTLDADGNIGNGTTLFTLTNGTFADNTVTAYINSADTAIHYTNTDGVYTAGKVYYWIGTCTAYKYGADNGEVNNVEHWSTTSGGTAGDTLPAIFDTAVFASERYVTPNVDIYYNMYINANITMARRGGGNTVKIGKDTDANIVIAENKQFSLSCAGNGSGSSLIYVYSDIVGSSSSTFAVSGADVNYRDVLIYGDTSKFKGTVTLTAAKTLDKLSICDGAAADNRYAKWEVFTNGIYPYCTKTADNSALAYSLFGVSSQTYKFGSLKAYVSNSSSYWSSGYAYSNYKVVLELGGEVDDASWLRGVWGAKMRITAAR